MSFFDVFGRDAVFPDPGDVAFGEEYGETTDNEVGTFTTFGSGSEDVTVTVNDPNTSLPVENATVYLTTDLAGNTLATPYQFTNVSGQATFKVNPGAYYLWVVKETLAFADIPQSITVVDV
jgi:hypothetical protein